jgi:hypothetical protein
VRARAARVRTASSSCAYEAVLKLSASYTVEDRTIDSIILAPDQSLATFNIQCTGPPGTHTVLYVRFCTYFCRYTQTYIHRPQCGTRKYTRTMYLLPVVLVLVLVPVVAANSIFYFPFLAAALPRNPPNSIFHETLFM